MNKIFDFFKQGNLSKLGKLCKCTDIFKCKKSANHEGFFAHTRHKENEEHKSHICSNKDCKKFLRKIPSTFESWEFMMNKKMQKMKTAYINQSISSLETMQKPHSGNIYSPNKNNHIIEIKNVNKFYFNKLSSSFQQILFNVNLEILQGEFVVILGESGSGKTTMLNIISGMERASNGEVIVANHNLITMNDTQLTNFRRKYVSIIFQNYALTADLTIRENVNFGVSLQDDVRKRLNVDGLYEQLEIATQKDKFPAQLSGGQQQRTAITKALAKNPKILFADEPTGAVDTKTCENILQIFKDINKKYKTTIILITHNQLISKIATKVIKIKSGKIVSVTLQQPKTVSQVDWSCTH